MKTRSQTKYENTPLYEVNLDFDAASEAWKANKTPIGNSSYKYVCQKRSKNNNMCISKCLHGKDYCRVHIKMFQHGKF